MLKIDYQKSWDLDRSTEFNKLYKLNSRNTFKETTRHKSHFSRNKYFVKYQQYYKNVLVEGGGFTSTYLIPDDPDDCEYLYMVSPYIVSNLDMNVSPSIGKSQLKDIMSNYHNTAFHRISDIKEELVIASSSASICNYSLAWKINYFYDGSKSIWINAQTGEIMKAVSRHQHLTADTHHYGEVQLADKNLGNGTTILTSPDDLIKIYDFSASSAVSGIPSTCANTPFDDDSLIPSTSQNTKWPTSAASLSMTQALFSVTLIKDIYANSFGISFGELKIGVDCDSHDASTIYSGVDYQGNIVIGFGGGHSRAVHDIIAHEMGHQILYPSLGTSNIGPSSLHEAISDMFGTYAESVIQGNTDWVMGDDNSNLTLLRDLENPGQDCFLNVEDFTEPHPRGAPLGHWFYLLSKGDGPNGIAPLGMKNVLKLILETLPNVSKEDADYPELRNVMITMVEDIYGVCSREAVSVTNAWSQICVGEPSSCFKIEGQSVLCEEEEAIYPLHLYITNPSPNNQYRWTFPIEWTIANNATQQGSSITDTYLRVVDFPDYDYYPQHFTVKVYSPALGSSYTQSKHITLKDCDGDDPSCLDFFANNTIAENRSLNTLFEENIDNITDFHVYNIYGQLVYQGLENNFYIQQTNYPLGIYIFCYFNQNGKLVKSEKRISTVQQ